MLNSHIAYSKFAGGLDEKSDMITILDIRSPIYTEGLNKPRDLNDGLGFDLFFSEEYKKKFVVFLHEFVMCMLELPKVKKQMILGYDSILDLTSPSDEALAVLFYVNNHEKWTNKHQHKDNPEHQGNKRTGGVFSNTRGKGRFRMGWTDAGMSLFHGAENFFKKAREQTKEWGELKVYCRTYFMTTMQYRQGCRTVGNKNGAGVDANSELRIEETEAPELDAIASEFYGNEDLENSSSNDDGSDESDNGEKNSGEDEDDIEDGDAVDSLIGLGAGSVHTEV